MRLPAPRPASVVPLPWLALALVALASAPAGAAVVTGAFVEAGTRAPLPAVEVVLRAAADSTAVVAHAPTDAGGRFRLDRVPPGRYRLTAARLGHASWRGEPFTLAAAQSSLDVGTQALAVAPLALPGVESRTARPNLIVASDRNIYPAKDLPTAAAGTATELLRGVSELDVDLDGHVTLRQGGGAVTFQFNGRPTPLKGDALTAYLRQMPSRRIASVEVIAHPSARYDPEGTGGIVNLVLTDDAGVGLSGSVNLTSGPRYTVPSAHAAWQRGPLTVFGELSGSFFHYKYTSSTIRQQFGDPAPGSFAWNANNRSDSRYGSSELSADYAPSKRITLYATADGSVGHSMPHNTTRFALADSAGAAATLYDRTTDGDGRSRSAWFTLGAQHVVTAGHNERSVEFLTTGTNGPSATDGLVATSLPLGVADQVQRQGGGYGYHERSVQADDTEPLGKTGKIEWGYRGADRATTSSSRLDFFSADTLVVTPASGATDYAHHERFHSGYVTVGGTVGRLSGQGGARLEFSRTRFDAHVSGRRFERDDRGFFPSGNLAWDLGKGRTLRATYSKRIERPGAFYLDPDALAADSLNHYVGNPSLRPRSTHAWGLDASWVKARGVLLLSPYLRNTVDSWDLVTRVDPGGGAIQTYVNASSVRVYGMNITYTMSQAGAFRGSLGLGLNHERHDASNVSGAAERDVTGWNGNANVTWTPTKPLSVSAYLRYAPPRALAQGRASSYTAFNLGATRKFGDRASLSAWLSDPLKLAHYSSTIGDGTYTQASSSDNHMRSFSLSLYWAWGKAPQEKQRKQSGVSGQEAPSGE